MTHNCILLHLILSVSTDQLFKIFTLLLRFTFLLRIIRIVVNVNLPRGKLRFILFWYFIRFFTWFFAFISRRMFYWRFFSAFKLLVLLYTLFQLTLPWNLFLLYWRLNLLQIRANTVFDSHIFDLVYFRPRSQYPWCLFWLF